MKENFSGLFVELLPCNFAVVVGRHDGNVVSDGTDEDDKRPEGVACDGVGAFPGGNGCDARD